MNFLFILNTFYPNIGGVETATFEICKKLRQRSHQIYVLTTNKSNFLPKAKPLAKYEKIDGIHIYRVRYAFRIFGVFLKAIFLAKKFKINFAYITDYWGGAALFLKRAYHIPFVYVLNGYNPICPTGTLYHHEKCHGFGVLKCLKNCRKLSVRFIISLLITRRLLSGAQRVVAISKAIQKSFSSYFKFNSIELLYYGVTLKQSDLTNAATLKLKYKIGGSEKIILFFGRLIRERGVAEFLDVFEEIIKEINCKFFIVGLGPETSSLLRKVEAQNLQKNVVFTGALRNQSLIDVIDLSDLVILPISFPEPLSLVVLEAMARGKPVVSFALGGVRELIENEKSGFLVQPSNWTDFANTIIRVLKDEKLRSRIGVVAQKQVVENFRWDYFIEEFLGNISWD